MHEPSHARLNSIFSHWFGSSTPVAVYACRPLLPTFFRVAENQITARLALIFAGRVSPMQLCKEGSCRTR